MNDKQIAVIGGTFTALGILSSQSANALLIERTGLLGKEFIDSFYPGTEWMSTEISRETEWLRDDYIKLSVLLKDGRVHLAGMAPTLYQHVKENNYSISLLTELIEVVPKGKEFEIAIFNASGKCTIRVNKIIDTSSRTLSTFGKHSRLKQKSVNALLYFEGAKETVDFDLLSQNVPEPFKIFPTGIESVAVLSVPIGIDTKWPEARMKIHKTWSARSSELSKWTIAAVAFEFVYETETGPWEVMPGWICIPSCAYRNPLEAYDAGVHAL